MVKFRIESGYLNDPEDLDPLIEWREVLLKTPDNIEWSKYRPFVTEVRQITIAPTSVRYIPPWDLDGAESSEEGEDSTEDEERSTVDGDELTDNSGTLMKTPEEPSDEDSDDSTYVKYLQGVSFASSTY